MQATWRLLLLYLTMAVLLSCNSVDLSRVESSYEGMSPLELKLGNRTSGYMQARYRVVSDTELQNYITDIRRALLANTTINLEYGEMIVVRDTGVFAYALPNGDIYLSSGMLLLADDEAEIAAVIAHELGHLLLQHSKQAHEREADLMSILAGLSMSADNPDSEVLDSLVSVLDYGNSRERETEADRLMLQLMQRSSYPPAAALSMLQRFYRLELEYDAANPSTRKTQVFDTHPNTRERLLLIEDSLDGSSFNQADKQHLRTRYREQAWSRLFNE